MSDQVRPGWKTTEFWFSAVAAVIGMVYASGVAVDGSPLERVLGILAAMLATLGYTVSRGIAKK